MTLPVAAQVKPLRADDIFPGLQKQVELLQSRRLAFTGSRVWDLLMSPCWKTWESAVEADEADEADEACFCRSLEVADVPQAGQ